MLELAVPFFQLLFFRISVAKNSLVDDQVVFELFYSLLEGFLVENQFNYVV